MRKIALSASVLLSAGLILVISVFRSAAIEYEIASDKVGDRIEVLGVGNVQVDYNLAFPGKILPNSIFWPIKAARDRLWLYSTANETRKAELELLFADKRLAAGKMLFDVGDHETGLSTIVKAERYLADAQRKERENFNNGYDTTDFAFKLALASLRHRQVIEELLETAPEEARPTLAETMDYSKNTYERAMHALNGMGIDAPKNPFDGK